MSVLPDEGGSVSEFDNCAACGHEWQQHDPADGRCDSFSDEPGYIGVCRCGREVAFTAEANARLSRAALRAANSQSEPEQP